MSCTKIFETKGVVSTATAQEVLPKNVLRKGLVLASGGGTVKVAVGASPVAADYFALIEGHPVIFDGIVPIGAVWVSGAGTLVYGESV